MFFECVKNIAVCSKIERYAYNCHKLYDFDFDNTFLSLKLFDFFYLLFVCITFCVCV